MKAPLLFAVCALVFASPALAADPPASTVAPVTVQGAAPPATVQKQAENFVKALAAPTAKIGQLARWRGPVCVQVIGLVPDQAARVKARVEAVAGGVGVKANGPGCRANVEIVFADQPQHLLDDMVAHGKYSVFGYHEPYQTKALTTMTRPVQSWYTTGTSGENLHKGDETFAEFKQGDQHPGGPKPTPMPQGAYPAISPNDSDATVDSPRSQTPIGCGDSRFSSCLESLFLNVLVVVDGAAMKGHDLGPVSDYVAMLAVSQPRSLDGCEDLASVIDLFAKSPCPGREAPDGLTAADAAYLTALYTADLDSKGQYEQGDVVNRMAEILVKAEKPAGR